MAVKLNRKNEDALAEQLARLAPPRSETPTAPMPAEQARPEKWPARISMTASQEMKRDLELARLDDGIEVTARLRAMIALWQEDPKLRAKVDKLAKDLR
jgi:glucose/arabinose dehydrogenase